MLFLLAVPVQVSLDYLQRLATLPLKETVLVSDTGSTKATIMTAAKELPFTFIGGHPMAGLAQIRSQSRQSQFVRGSLLYIDQ